MFASWMSGAWLAALPFPVVLLLYGGACVGHAVLVIVTLNCLYGFPIPHKALSWTRKFDALVVLAGPVLFWLAFGPHLFGDSAAALSGFWGYLLGTYVALCWFLGLVVFPAVTLQRLLRRTPAALLKNDTVTVDVARQLGYKPAGRGKYRRAALLPFNQVFQVDFSERTLVLPRLPAALDGLTILHVSDLHLCGTPDRIFYQIVMDRCRAWDPEIVAVTGDVVDSEKHHGWIIPVLGRLRWKAAAYAILGNHDSWYDETLIRRRLRRLGMEVLGNGWVKAEIRGETVVVVGHEGPWFGPPPDLTDCPDGPFRLCLSHTPDNIAWARRHRMDLVLAGHVHGGQIRFPVIGSVFVPSRYSRRYDCGTFDEPPTLMHVSRGLAGQHPLRFNCRPEVTLLILRRAPQESAP